MSELWDTNVAKRDQALKMNLKTSLTRPIRQIRLLYSTSCKGLNPSKKYLGQGCRDEFWYDELATHPWSM